jgi:hypothetical protein
MTFLIILVFEKCSWVLSEGPGHPEGRKGGREGGVRLGRAGSGKKSGAWAGRRSGGAARGQV